MNSSRHVRIAFASLLLLVVLLYLPALRFELLSFDDNANITDNPFLHPPSQVWGMWTATYRHLYIPLSYTAWALVCWLTDFSPAALHGLNVLSLSVSVILVRAILERVGGRGWPALAGAAVFALHPMQVESVAWVTSFKGLLSGTLALGAYLLYLVADQREGHRRSVLRGLSLLAFAGALLAKTTALVLPLMILCQEFFHDHRPLRQCLHRLRSWLALAVSFSLVGVASYTPNPAIPPQNPIERLHVALDALFCYLLKALVPVSSAIDTGHNAQFVLGTGWTWGTAAVPIALAIALYRYTRSTGDRLPAASAAMFVVALLPMLGLKPHDMEVMATACDRYLFLALFAVAYAVSAALARYELRPWIGIVVMGSCLSASAIQTRRFLAPWQEDRTFWTHVLEHNPGSWLAWTNMGAYWQRNREWERAIEAYRRSILIVPSEYGINNSAICLAQLRRFREAAQLLARALQSDPGNRLFARNLQSVWSLMSDADRAAMGALPKNAEEWDRQPAGALPYSP